MQGEGCRCTEVQVQQMFRQSHLLQPLAQLPRRLLLFDGVHLFLQPEVTSQHHLSLPSTLHTRQLTCRRRLSSADIASTRSS